MEFLQQLDEAHLLRHTNSIEAMGIDGMVETALLELSNLVMFQQDKTAQQYAKQTLQGNFQNWRTSGTDLHNAIAALNNPEYRKRLGVTYGTPNVLLLQKILRDAQLGKANPNDFNKFAMGLQRDFRVSRAPLTSIRRRVADYGALTPQQQQQLSGDITRAYGPTFAQSDVAVIKKVKPSSIIRSLGKWAAITAGSMVASYYLGKKLAS